MTRRGLLAVEGAALALGLVAGCGPVYRTTLKAESAVAKVEMALLPNRLDYTVYQPSHRVVLATLDVMKAELAEAEITDVELSQDDNFNPADRSMPKPAGVKIPEGYPAFWMDGLNPNGPVLVNCRNCDFRGKTKDGKKVEASVRLEIMGSDQRTVVSVQVGSRGDSKDSKALIDKISERVQQASTRPSSPDEHAALQAAFAPKPDDGRKFLASGGEVRIKKD